MRARQLWSHLRRIPPTYLEPHEICRSLDQESRDHSRLSQGTIWALSFGVLYRSSWS